MASSVPDTPNALLTRRDAAVALTAAGYPGGTRNAGDPRVTWGRSAVQAIW